MQKRGWFKVLLAMMLFVACRDGASGAEQSTLGDTWVVDEAAGVVKNIGKYVGKINTLRDVALNALDNAMALRESLNQELVDVLADGDKNAISRARKARESALHRSDEAVDLTEKVVEYAVQANAALKSAEEIIHKIVAGGDQKAMLTLLRKTEDILRIVEKVYKKVDSVVAVLRKEWLVPDKDLVQSDLQSHESTTTLQSESVTPVGKR